MILRYWSLIGLSFLLALGVRANSINVSPGDAITSGSGNPTQSDLEDVIESLPGSSLPPWFGELYRDEADPPGEEGPFASSYTTTYLPNSSEAEGFEIRYDGVGSVMTGAQYLLVKGPNGGGKNPIEPSWYLFDITGWDGDVNQDMPIIGSGFWDGNGAVSHLRILGVPDGGATLALLGLSLLGMTGLRRFFSRRTE